MNIFDFEMTSPYGERVHPVTGEISNHNGVDLAMPLNTGVTSMTSGEVVVNSSNSARGKFITIKDGNGNLHTYQHLNNTSVEPGDVVKRGDLIGLSGNTGMSTGPHLHYEVKDSSGQYINPVTFTDLSVNEYYLSAGEDMTLEYERTAMDGSSLWAWVGPFVGNIFKWLIIILILILFVYFIYKSIEI